MLFHLWKKFAILWILNIHNLKASPIPAGGLEVLLLRTCSVKSERMFQLMKSFVNNLYDNDYTGEQAEYNEEQNGDNEEIDIKINGEGNATNENNENVIEIEYPFLFQIVFDLNKKKKFFINNFPKISQ